MCNAEQQGVEMELTFPYQLDRIRDGILAQEAVLREIAQCFADVISTGGLVHIYAVGHSRIAVEEFCVRMGALTGFHPLLSQALANFTDVVGADSLRLNQAIEKIEGLGAKILDEFEFAADEPLIVVSATGQTQAAVDMALEFNRRYPRNPLVAITSLEQSREAAPKHSSGKTLYHVTKQAERGFLIDNCMPVGDVSITVEGQEHAYKVCPLSSIGALTIVQSLNELLIRELMRRGHRHLVLQNMHLGQTQVNYDEWLTDQRTRYAKALSNPARLTPIL
jgi:uncharacterized phosphosugar-binding protein